MLAVPGHWLGATLIFTVAVAVTVDVGRFGGRRAFAHLGGGFLILTAISLLASRFLLVDVLFAPLALAASISAITMQLRRLRLRDIALTEKLIAASWKFESPNDDAEHRFTERFETPGHLLSPSELVVFRRGADGRLVSSARLRANQGSSPDTSRNSAWRDGVNLCVSGRWPPARSSCSRSNQMNGRQMLLYPAA